MAEVYTIDTRYEITAYDIAQAIIEGSWDTDEQTEVARALAESDNGKDILEIVKKQEKENEHDAD
jgi:hypothetical protein